jgi:hypothetical protein
MTYRLLIFSACLAAAISAHAGSTRLEYMTVGSITYSNVTVFGANATDLFFSSDHGVSNVKLKFLSPDLQRKFNYNPATSDKAEQQQIADSKRYQDNVAATIMAELRAAKQAKEAAIQAPYAEAGLADPVSDQSPIGKAAPEMNFVRWVGGRADFVGKFAIVSIWSPKSASCRKWIPAINSLHKSLMGKVEVFGITTAAEDDVEKTEPKIEFPCAIDAGGKFLEAAHITVLPCVLLLDTNRMIRYEGHPAAVTTNSLQSLFKGDEE